MADPTTIPMSEFVYIRPDMNEVRQRFESITERFDAADTFDAQKALIAESQTLRRELQTMGSLAAVRFRQDTQSEDAKAEKEFFDENRPVLRELGVNFARKVLASPHREAFASEWGQLFLDILDVDVSSFDPAIADEMREDAKLFMEYTSLKAAATIEFEGEELNLARLAKHFSDPDREHRKKAQLKRWQWFADNADQLNRIFDDLVRVRQSMGTKLGHENYVPVGYQRMTRTEYGPAEVAEFRRQVREHVVPLATETWQEQAKGLGLDRLTAIDEPVKHPDGNPKPIGSEDDTIATGSELYRQLGPEFHEFYEKLAGRGLMDLKSRPGKAGGGFCTRFVNYQAPFIFANFNGTKGDVRVMTHECGHAFQGWMSRTQPLLEYLSPTAEACEIHSMGLEFLTWPQMDLFFGDDADRFRKDHLIESLQFLPYACTVDEFQHRIYEQPELTPAQRFEVWQELEATYLPHRDYDGLPHCSAGGFWQAQQHIYGMPFYYIDYALALTGAMQLWHRAIGDREATMRDYVELCKLGGSRPYLELLKAVKLESPFEPGTLKTVVGACRDWLDAN